LEVTASAVETALVHVEAGTPSTGSQDQLVRRVRLPADRRTPATARKLVRELLAAANLDGLLDAALLLTTELSTNGVVHAGTELDIEVIVDRNGLTVTVMDFASGTLNQLPAPAAGDPTATAELAERGRGLLLVDHFATRWGTTHHASGKGVWFRLDAPGGAAAGSDHWPAAVPSTEAMAGLLQVGLDPHADDAIGDFAAELLSRLGQMVGATGGVVRYDRGDGAGPLVLARYGRPRRTGTDRLRVPLAVSRPSSGELELDVPPSAHARPLAHLVAERLALTLENDRLRRADRRRQSWLTFLAEASELLAHSLDVELTLALIPQLVVPRLGRWCAVHTANEWGQPRLAAATHADEEELPKLRALLDGDGPDSVPAALRDALRTGSHTLLGAPAEGFAVPLVARGQRLGTLTVGRHAGHRHDPDEIAVLEDVARRAALAVDNARIHAERRRVAHTLQQSLLPPVLPVVRGIGFAAEYVPTGDDAEVGGDFYDVVPLPDDRWLVVVGDVSGKGVQAAAVTGLVRDVIRVLVRDGRPLDEALVQLNDTLVERGGGRYCTLALAAVDRDGGDRLAVTLRLAGHDRPVLVRSDGRASFVGAGGTALGLLHSITSPVTRVPLAPGDTLVFYTDGVTERRRGRELFGNIRLREAAAPLAGYTADVVAARLRTATLGFSAEAPRDDIAILVLRNEAS
jgi:serine phosphatase RsbU (regulator of sigma subunit)/anti-sigma regulatory factor (Ser/Thr protein kinase)